MNSKLLSTFHFLLFTFYFLPAIPTAQWPQFRGPGGQGHSSEQGLPLEWSGDAECRVEDANPRPRMVIAGHQQRTRLAHHFCQRRPRRVASRSGPRCRERTRARERRSLPAPERRYSKTRRTATHPRRPSSRRWRCMCTSAAKGPPHWTPCPGQQSGRRSVCVAARQRRIGNAPRRSAYFQRRRPLRSVGHRARQADWRRAMEDRAPQAVRSGLHNAARHLGQRPRSSGQRRRISAAAYDVETGKEIWMVRYEDGFSNVPSRCSRMVWSTLRPAFFSPRFSPSAVDGRGDVTNTHIAWSATRGAPFTPSPIAVGDELYVISDLGVLSCFDARTGKVRWQQRIGGNTRHRPLFADRRIYFLSEEGVATVIAPGPTFRKLAVNELDGATLASMAVAKARFHPQPHTPVPDRKKERFFASSRPSCAVSRACVSRCRSIGHSPTASSSTTAAATSADDQAVGLRHQPRSRRLFFRAVDRDDTAHASTADSMLGAASMTPAAAAKLSPLKVSLRCHWV